MRNKKHGIPALVAFILGCGFLLYHPPLPQLTIAFFRQGAVVVDRTRCGLAVARRENWSGAGTSTDSPPAISVARSATFNAGDSEMGKYLAYNAVQVERHTASHFTVSSRIGLTTLIDRHDHTCVAFLTEPSAGPALDNSSPDKGNPSATPDILVVSGSLLSDKTGEQLVQDARRWQHLLSARWVLLVMQEDYGHHSFKMFDTGKSFDCGAPARIVLGEGVHALMFRGDSV